MQFKNTAQCTRATAQLTVSREEPRIKVARLRNWTRPDGRGNPDSEGTMPLYEYLCSDCAHQFERIVKFSDAPVTTCPKCGKETLEQMISAPAVQFKGSGWYVTDYAHKSGSLSSSSASSDRGSDTGKASSGNGGGESSSASPATEKNPGGNGSSASSGQSSAGSSSNSGSSSSNSGGDSGTKAKSDSK